MKYAFLVFPFIFFVPQAAFAALQNFGGFEAGSAPAEHSIISNSSVQSSIVKNGTYAYRANPSTTNTGAVTIFPYAADGATTNAIACTNPCSIGFWFRADTIPASLEEQMLDFQNNAGGIGYLTLESDGQIGLYDASPAAGIGTSTTALSSGTWYFIELQVSGGATAAYELKIDGVSQFSGTRSFDAGTIRAISLGKRTNRNGQTVDFYYDDFYMNDSSYITNARNSKVLAMVPNATGGTYTAFAAGTNSSNFAEADEIPNDSDTTYVKSTNADEAVAFGMQNTSAVGISGTILGMRAVARLRDETGTSINSLRIRSGATDNDTTARDPGASYASTQKVYETDPATSAAWTTSGLDAVEVGATDGAGSSVRIRLTAAYAMVYFTPAAATETAVTAKNKFVGGVIRFLGGAFRFN